MIYNLSDNTWDQCELDAIQSVIASNQFTMANRVKEYEQAFAKKFGAKYAVCVNSGSSANLLAIAALVYSGRFKKGDEIIVPAVSWSTTYFPINQHGLKLRFVDIDINTLNIDVSKIENAITHETKGIMIVNLLGNPNYFDDILSIAQKHNLVVIEDNCESMGAKYKGKSLGSIGTIGTFSTFFSHHICTMEGGVAITDDEELYHYMLSIRAHGWTRHLPKDSKIYKKSDDPFYESFNFIMPGYNLRPTELVGAIGVEQLKKLDSLIANRRINAEYFKKKIAKFDWISTQQEVESSSWFGFAMLLNKKAQGKRNIVIKHILQNNIETRPIVTGNFLRHASVKYLDYSVYQSLSNADYIHDNGFFIGNHSVQNTNLIDFFIEKLEEIEKDLIK